MEIIQQIRGERVGPVRGGVMVADEIVGQRLNAKGRNRIKSERAAGRIEAVIVVVKAKVVLFCRLPV